MATEAGDGFLSRWSRRKRGEPVEPAVAVPPAVAPVMPSALPNSTAVAVRAATPAAPADAPPAVPPPPTLDDVAALPDGANVARFVARDVDPVVKNAALKKLFADPHYNLMDGLDTYIDDYGKPDPLPESMLRQMVQAHALGLFREEEQAAAAADPDNAVPAPTEPPAEAGPTTPTIPADPADPEPLPHEDAAVQLQPDDAAGPAGAGAGAGEDARRQR